MIAEIDFICGCGQTKTRVRKRDSVRVDEEACTYTRDRVRVDEVACKYARKFVRSTRVHEKTRE